MNTFESKQLMNNYFRMKTYDNITTFEELLELEHGK